MSIRDLNNVSPDSIDLEFKKKQLELLTQISDSVGSQLLILIDNKEDGFSVLPVSKGGTGSSAPFANNRLMISDTGSIVELSAITSNRALISDSNGLPTHSGVSNTQLEYLAGLGSLGAGDLIYFDGTNLVRIPAGTSGQLLQSNGTSIPTWTTQDQWFLVTGNVDNLTNTLIDITGLSATVEANSVYAYSIFLRVGCNNTGGVVIGVEFPTGGELSHGQIARGNAIGTPVIQGLSPSTSPAEFAAINTANSAVGTSQLEGTLFSGTAGTFKLSFRSNVDTQTSTIFKGSRMMLRKIA